MGNDCVEVKKNMNLTILTQCIVVHLV